MKKVFFYDTCSLLNELHSAFENDFFYISSVTLEELENIKTSSSKDQDIKYRARQLLHLLFENKDMPSSAEYTEPSSISDEPEHCLLI